MNPHFGNFYVYTLDWSLNDWTILNVCNRQSKNQIGQLWRRLHSKVRLSTYCYQKSRCVHAGRRCHIATEHKSKNSTTCSLYLYFDEITMALGAAIRTKKGVLIVTPQPKFFQPRAPQAKHPIKIQNVTSEPRQG